MSFNPRLDHEVNVTSATFSADYRGMIKCDCTSNAITVTLPDATVNAGARYVIKKSDSSANAVTIATTSSQTIDGSTTKSLSTQYYEMEVFSDGSNWSIVSNFTGGGGGGSPGGSNTQVQYNSSGSFAGSTNLTWGDTARTLTIGTSGASGGLQLYGQSSGSATIRAQSYSGTTLIVLPSGTPVPGNVVTTDTSNRWTYQPTDFGMNLSHPLPGTPSYLTSNTIATNFTAVGAGIATGSFGTASNAFDSTGLWINYLSAASIGSSAGFHGGINSYSGAQSPYSIYIIRTGASGTDISSGAMWIGLLNITSGYGTATPNAQIIGFRGLGGTDTNWQAYVGTSNTNNTIVDTGIAISPNTAYVFGIDWNTSPSTIYFRINGNIVASISTTLPSTTYSAYQHQIINSALTSTAVNIQVRTVFGILH